MFAAIGSFLGGMGNALPVASAALDIMSGISSRRSHSQAASSALAIGDREARQSLLAGQIEAERVVRQGERDVGRAIALSGAAGLQMRGSVLDLIANSYANIEMDRLNTLYNAQRDADLIRERSRAQARQTQAQGRANLTRSLGSAAMTIAGSGLFSSQEGI